MKHLHKNKVLSDFPHGNSLPSDRPEAQKPGMGWLPAPHPPTPPHMLLTEAKRGFLVPQEPSVFLEPWGRVRWSLPGFLIYSFFSLFQALPFPEGLDCRHNTKHN